MTLNPQAGCPATAGSAQQFWIRLCAVAIAVPCSVAEAADNPPPPPGAPVQAVVVTAPKLSVETLIDRKVYSVTSDVQSTFGTLSDVLSVIPSVDVDPDGIVSLRGDTNVLMLIDGKPSAQLSSPAAGDNLQSIPARDIERVEPVSTENSSSTTGRRPPTPRRSQRRGQISG